MKNFIESGDVLTLTAPSGGVTSGRAYKIGSLIVVATVAADQGDPFAAQVTGVVTHAKATPQAWTEGEKLYWDDSAKKFTATSGGNTLCGVAAAVAGSSAATGKVRLDGVVR